MTTIAANLQAVRQRITRAAQNAGRSPSAIALIAVSKTWSAACIAEAYACGQCAFGESYAQEALEKIERLAQLRLEWPVDSDHHEIHRAQDDVPGPSSGVASPPAGPLLRPLEWHFIGPIQSNKTRALAERFQWVHSVARGKIAQRLNDARPEALPALNVCIQVNVSGEASKSGVQPGEELALARAIVALPRLKLRGLMAVPEPTPDVKLERQRFALLREIKNGLGAAGFALDTLSMGMSDDLESAILEGATMVRVGTAIFGPRHDN
jgi:uncharacterized pyridoxal phosphate-containing UPF0001 family protein